MARHAVVDLAQVFSTPPGGRRRRPAVPRTCWRVCARSWRQPDLPSTQGSEVDTRLADLRRMYEPYAIALSRHLLQPLPAWHYETRRRDNWQTSAWDKTSAAWME